MAETGVYKITSPTGRVYVGSSINIKERFCKYKRLNCKKQTKIYRSFKKHGVENHKFEVVLLCDPKDRLMYERIVGDHYTVMENGLNCNLPGYGEMVGEVSKETREKLRITSTGRKHSNETKEYLRKINKGRFVSEETRKKQSQVAKTKVGHKNNFYGRFHTNSSKIKMSNSSKNKKKLTLINTNTGEEFVGIQYDFRLKYNLTQSKVSALYRGEIKKYKNWEILSNG